MSGKENHKTISFDEMPKVLMDMHEKLNEMYNMLSIDKKPESDFMSIDELVEYLPFKIKKSTIYQKTHNNEIPYIKEGKQLAFQKSAIDQWLLSHSFKTKRQLLEQA